MRATQQFHLAAYHQNKDVTNTLTALLVRMRIIVLPPLVLPINSNVLTINAYLQFGCVIRTTIALTTQTRNRIVTVELVARSILGVTQEDVFLTLGYAMETPIARKMKMNPRLAVTRIIILVNRVILNAKIISAFPEDGDVIMRAIVEMDRTRKVIFI